MINKKGVGVGQVFIFIIAALTFSMIMIFGYKSISDFISSGEKVQLVQFKTGLESSIKKIYTEYGSVRIQDFRLPGKFEQICFVDMDYPADALEMEQLCAKDAYACSVWQDARSSVLSGKSGYASVDENVFFNPASEDLTKVKVFKVSMVDEQDNPQGFLCLDVKEGGFSLVMEGKGDHTQLSAKSKEEFVS